MSAIKGLLVFTCVLVAAAFMHATMRHQPEADLDSVFAHLNRVMLDLGLVEVDCPREYDSDPYRYRKCFASPYSEEEFIQAFDVKVIGSYSRAFGWRQDYGVWGAFYHLLSAPDISFSVGVKSAFRDQEITKLMPNREFVAFVRLTLERSTR
ncbi:hypothetical protein [Calidithermus terrae]|uniref:hypothetical protein n=1 Tax=Calidithermus terrae TaxID=1408545 RepID=UPI0011C39099|nr:hypothetical protein [Calidithermus terrae]